MKIIKLFLWVMLGLAVIIIAGYFLYSYTSMNDKGIAQDYFSGKIYAARDLTTRLAFGESAENAVLLTDGTQYKLAAEYSENVFTLSSDEITVYVIVLEEGILYSATGGYLYYFGE